MIAVEHHVHQASVVEWTGRLMFGTVPPLAGAFQNREVAVLPTGAAGHGGTTVLTGVGSRVVSGLGGVGKTQLAAECARALWDRDEVDVLMWVGATSRDAVLTAYARAASVVVSVPSADAEDAAVRWLEWLAATEKRWLVVLDDMRDPADVRGLWPPHTSTGGVVVTTRRRDAALEADGRRVVQVGLFTPAESAAFLSRRLSSRPTQAAGAAELAEELGHLPVALAQAAAYIADRASLTCASYLTRWLDHRRTLSEVLPCEDELPDEHSATTATTWSLSVALADRLRPVGLARPLLHLASMLDPNGIPETVFTAPATLAYLGHEVDQETAIDALSCLHRLNLIVYEPDVPHRAVRVHALVQRATRETLEEEQFCATLCTAANALAEVWPETERDTDLAAVLRANTDALLDIADDLLWHPLLFRAGGSLGEAGQVHAAVAYFDRLRTIAEQLLGVDHHNTLLVRQVLARWMGEAGDAAGAVLAAQQVLADCERVLGGDHFETLSTRYTLARWRGEAGDVAGAIAVSEHALVECERVLGADHPQTLVTRGNLGWWRGEAGDVEFAVAVHEQVLADYERVRGVDHSDTLSARGNLARWQSAAGDRVDVGAVLAQVLADCERVLGTDHLHTLTTRANLADWLGRTGDVVGAIAAYEDVLVDHERVLGADHPGTRRTCADLAKWRRHEEAGTSCM